MTTERRFAAPHWVTPANGYVAPSNRDPYRSIWYSRAPARLWWAIECTRRLTRPDLNDVEWDPSGFDVSIEVFDYIYKIYIYKIYIDEILVCLYLYHFIPAATRGSTRITGTRYLLRACCEGLSALCANGHRRLDRRRLCRRESRSQLSCLPKIAATVVQPPSIWIWPDGECFWDGVTVATLPEEIPKRAKR